MTVHFGQIYIEPDIYFDFSTDFQLYLAKAVSELIDISPTYIKRFGGDYELMFRVSAKTCVKENDIKGPQVFRKDKDVEYTIFLPYKTIMRNEDFYREALRYLFQGVYTVLESLDIDVARLKERESSLIDTICGDPSMFQEDEFGEDVI